MEGVSQLPVAVDEQLMNQSTLGPASSAFLYTTVSVFSGIASAPVYLGNEGATFTDDPSMLNIPMYGDIANELALSGSNYLDDPKSSENKWGLVSAFSQAFIATFAPGQMVSGKTKAKLTAEAKNSSRGLKSNGTETYAKDKKARLNVKKIDNRHWIL